LAAGTESTVKTAATNAPIITEFRGLNMTIPVVPVVIRN
jgi:hypothetical protein